MAVLAKPGVTLLLGGGQFGEDEINLLSRVIQVYAFSVPLESLLHIYHRSYYSLKNTTIPAFSHALVIFAMIVMAKTLAPQIGIIAIPVGFTIGLVFHIIILATIFPILLKKKGGRVYI